MAPHPLTLLVNGDPQEVPEGCTVGALLVQLGVERQRIAVAVNREVIPRRAFASLVLAAGDRVEVLRAVGGG